MNTVPSTIDNSMFDCLTDEQFSVIIELLKGKNIALLGAAGCGKSYLLSIIYSYYPHIKKIIDSDKNKSIISKLSRIQLCAMTGCAALLLGHKAKTIHSWAGIGLGKGSVSELYIKIRRNQKSMRNWLSTDLLIIDEISMMTAELLNKLNELAKKIRGNKKPFGGIQIMLVGDFYQLPPVNKSDEDTMFAFESLAWKDVIQSTIELTYIHRQKDEIFQKILKEARIGNLSKESCDLLMSRKGLNWKKNKVRPTLIFPRRAEVQIINDSNLKALTGRRYTYTARFAYDGKVPEDFDTNDPNFKKIVASFDSDASYSTELELALNAQVMLVANIDPDSGLVNGSRGVITGFCPSTELPFVEFINGVKKTIGTHGWPIENYEFVSRTQIPLRLAYSITCHRTQGSTLDSALIDIGSGIFEYGQAYVALSRVRSLDSLYIHDFDPSAFRVHTKVKEFYTNITLEKIDYSERLRITQLIQTFNNNISADDKPILSEISAPIKGIYVNKLDSPAIDTDSNNWLYNSLPQDWIQHITPCKDTLLTLSTLLSTKDFLPKKEDIWKALELTPLNTIKVVILGQDPYPTPGNAMGLAFSVQSDIYPIPQSLKNIYKELVSDIGFIPPKHGNLEEWSKQGVMLLNTVLSVDPGCPQSHSKIGWEKITDHIIQTILLNTTHTIFVLWGKSAQAKTKLIQQYNDTHHHYIIESAHPSPLSASRGFFNSKPFSKINQILSDNNKIPINWAL